MEYEIDEMQPSDWEQVKKIYIEGIRTGIATFQSEAPTYEEWDKAHHKFCRLVARLNNEVLGWVALSPTSSRTCYSGVAELSIYISENSRGNGLGNALLLKAVRHSEENGIWTLYSGIIRDNAKSIKLHKKCGFREIGLREKIAKMPSGKWHDVMLMERRSKVIGID